MPLGRRLRGILGPCERPVSEWSRALFFDLEAFVEELVSWCSPASILEIGCGHGHMTEALSRAFPNAAITGIDIGQDPGRLFGGDRGRVQFRRQEAAHFVAERGAAFDLAVLSDVLHHVPASERAAVVGAGFAALLPGGCLAIKDWEGSRTPIHLFAYMSDRFVTGDRVRFEKVGDFERLVTMVAADAVIERCVRLPPWRNNFALLARRVERPASGPVQNAGV
jgi:2-polyprenyl-6-hydroxyphenyl methylase/3-demethylubiquinone-9 3-methyltransferase